MLEMAQINCIRTLRQLEGKSISEIARIMDVDWRTARKYADGDELPVPKPRKRKRPKMGPFMEHLEAMILEDMNIPAGQRRTARAMYEQLVELGYEGSARTVRHWVQRIKPELYAERKERFVRLEHAPGEAQVDFQQSWKYSKYPSAQLEKFHVLVMSFPYSNATVSRALPAENGECLLSALQSMFEEIGGVPPVMVFDNLSPAVKAIKKDDRELTDLFARFKWHYRFEARFCNPASPHEKGNVEKKVSYVRRNALSPPPVVEDLQEINDLLRERAEKDLQRIHYRREVPVGQLWEEDRAALYPLPSSRYEVFRTGVARANQYSAIQVSGESYRIPKAYPGQRVLVKLWWDRVEAFDEEGTLLGHKPREYAFDVRKVDWKAELEIFKSKPRAVEQAVCLKVFPEELRQFILSAPLSKRPQRVCTLISLFDRGYDLDEIKDAVELARNYDRTDEASLLVLAGYRESSTEPLDDPYTPEEARNWQPDMNQYALLTARMTDDGD